MEQMLSGCSSYVLGNLRWNTLAFSTSWDVRLSNPSLTLMIFSPWYRWGFHLDFHSSNMNTNPERNMNVNIIYWTQIQQGWRFLLT
jgi:hypothetical protein